MFLRTLRLRRKLTQEQLEAETARHGLRVSQSIICRYETKAVNPRWGHMVALAKALGVEPGLLRVGPDPRDARRQERVA